jgi:hypothetical protein
MKLKLLLLFLGISGILWSQVPYDSTLIITEVGAIENQFNNTYVEVTNVGDEPLDLANFKFGKGRGSNDVFCNDIYLQVDGRWGDLGPYYDNYFFLPESVSRILEPGESFVMTIGLDFSLNGYKQRLPAFAGGDRDKNHNIYQYADFIAYRETFGELKDLYGDVVKDSAIYSPDSALTNTDYVFSMGHLSNLSDRGFFIEQHFLDENGNPDSVVVDQYRFDFNGSFCRNSGGWKDVAGVPEATGRAYEFRQRDVTKGNLNWNVARGNSLESSEWIAITLPDGWDNWRDYWWTVGSHTDRVLDATTLEPKDGENITVDFTGKTITAPWGIRRLDDIMRRMERKEGVAWKHILNGVQEDSLKRSLQTGDRLVVYCIGNTLTLDTFDIVVNDPLESDNIVIPIDHPNEEGPITNNAQAGKISWPRVTAHGGTGVVDTITGARYGIPFNTRIDTLAKYLEMPPNASFEIEFVDGETRADLKNGDKMFVTAENGDVKEYLIEVRDFEPNSNTNLTSITWPDIDLDPLQRFKYGWPLTGDTIPGFLSSVNTYRVTLPPEATSIPALVGKPENLNSKVAVDRAWTFDGGQDERTTTFTVTAESDSVETYTVETVKEVDRSTLQKWTDAEPLFSKFYPKGTRMIEIFNPGDDTLDLSHYMFVGNHISIEAAITQSGTADSASWAAQRYKKYIPGRKWKYYDEWATAPNTVDSVPDPAVHSILKPGGTFVIGHITEDGYLADIEDPDDQYFNELCDVVFLLNKDNPWTGEYGTYTNTWNEPIGGNCPIRGTLANTGLMLFKILNDSVRHGQKPATDLNDFELIDVIGTENLSGRYNPGGSNITGGNKMIRKPEIVKPNPIPAASFGTTEEDSEWIVSGYNKPDDLAQLGEHFFFPYTGHLSIVESPIYSVAPGYEDVTIDGVTTGTVYEAFMDNIYPLDKGQTMVVKSGEDTLKTGDALTEGDMLVVTSADESNTTSYTIDVSDTGLSDDAVLTSDPYDVSVDGETGAVAGMEFSTLLTDVVDNVTVPEGAILTVVDEYSRFVPFKKLSITSNYFDATANYDTYFEVLAENKSTKIVYQLQPTVADDTVFVTSDVYMVSQDEMLISEVPFGTSYATFIETVMPSPGATLQVFDKEGYERTAGDVAADDRLVVTSADGEMAKVYFLSLFDLQTGKAAGGFLAYLTSEEYLVNQVIFEISEFGNQTTVEEFIANVTPASGATMKVVDADGNEKASGDTMVEGDMVIVTSGNGETTVVYVIGTLVGFETMMSDHQIKVYPNPTNSVIHIDELKTGSRIQVFNVTGVKLLDIQTVDQHSVISLDGEKGGLYIISISDKDNTPIGQYKVLKN